MTAYLGVDLGGTNFKAGLVRDGSIVSESINRVHKNLTEAQLIETLYKTVDAIVTKDTKAIGAGIPGVVDPSTGTIYDILNLPNWQKIPLKSLLEGRYKVPVFLNNDANCFAKGEKVYGAGKPYTNFVGLSIGTGLGMGVIINNTLYNGVFCGAGEIGMVPYRDSIVEHYASSLFFERTYNTSAKDMSKLALQGDAKAIKAFNEFGVHLGIAIHTVLYMYAPEAIIMGGSISKSFALFKEAMEKTVKSFAYAKQIEHLKMEVSTLKGSPILGAAALCVE